MQNTNIQITSQHTHKNGKVIFGVFIYFKLGINVCVWGGYVHMSAGAKGGQKGAQDPRELKLGMGVRCLMRVLGRALRSS